MPRLRITADTNTKPKSRTHFTVQTPERAAVRCDKKELTLDVVAVEKILEARVITSVAVEDAAYARGDSEQRWFHL